MTQEWEEQARTLLATFRRMLLGSGDWRDGLKNVAAIDKLLKEK